MEKDVLMKEKNIRAVWDDELGVWYFSVYDIIKVVTDSKNPKQYVRNLINRDVELKCNWKTISVLVQLISKDEKKHKEISITVEGVFCIIQSLPSQKAELFSRWMAQVETKLLNENNKLSTKNIVDKGMCFVALYSIILEMLSVKNSSKNILFNGSKKFLSTYFHREEGNGLSSEEKEEKNKIVYGLIVKNRERDLKSFALARIGVDYEDARNYFLRSGVKDKCELRYRIKRSLCSMRRLATLYSLSNCEIQEYFARNNYVWRSELFLFYLP